MACSTGVNSSDHINTIVKHDHTWVILENVDNLLIFREKVLYVWLYQSGQCKSCSVYSVDIDKCK